MLPDDPLGRGGPNLDEMLSVTNKSFQSGIQNDRFLLFLYENQTLGVRRVVGNIWGGMHITVLA